MVESDGSERIQLERAVDAGHLDRVLFGDLHTDGSNPAAGAIDQDSFALSNLPNVDQALQREHGGMGKRRCLFERHARRLATQGILAHTNVVGKAPKPCLGYVAVYVIPGLKSRCPVAGSLDSSGNLCPEHGPLGLTRPNISR